MLRKVSEPVLLSALNSGFAARITTEAGYNLSRSKFEFNPCDWLWRSAATLQIKKEQTWRTVKLSLDSR